MADHLPGQYLTSNVSCTRNQQTSGPVSELMFETLARLGMPLIWDKAPRVGVPKYPDCDGSGYLTEVESRLLQFDESRVLVLSLPDDVPRE